MEDEGETSNMDNHSLLPKVEGPVMQEEPLETAEFTKTELVLPILPQLGESEVVGASSSIAAKGEGAVAEEDAPVVGVEMQMETGVEGAEHMLDNSVPQVDDPQGLHVVHVESPMAARDDETVTEEVISTVGTAMEEKIDTKWVEGVLANSVAELGDSQLFGVRSAVDVGNDTAEKNLSMVAETTEVEADATETAPVKPVHEVDSSQVIGAVSSISAQDVTVLEEKGVSIVGEMEAAAEGVEGSEVKSVLDVDRSQLISTKTSTMTQDDEMVREEEIEIGATQMKTETGEEGVQDWEGRYISDVDGAHFGPVNSSIGADNVEAVGMGEVPDGDHEIEIGAENFLPELDNGQLIDVQSTIAAKVGEEDEAMDKGQVGMTLNEMEMMEGSAADFATELDNVPLSSHLSPIAAKRGEVDEARADGQVGMTETEAEEEVEEKPVQFSDGSQHFGDISTKGDNGEELMEDDETATAEIEMETETDVVEALEPDKGGIVVGKRKRGRSSKVPTRPPSRKAIGEDVCFICFDGGELVLCDRRGCPKAYHPSCVNRDEAFFRAKGRWNCGWHLCSICGKNAHYMCYTCTFSLCKGCTKDAVILCMRGNKGFCENCMKTVMLIENSEGANKEDQVDFDDKSSWEYLFKDYWMDLKAKLSLSPGELAQAKNPRRGSDVFVGKEEANEEVFDANNEDSGSDSSDNLEASKPRRRMPKRRSKTQEKIQEVNLPNAATAAIAAERTPVPGNTEWASKELQEFVMHMKNGDNSVLSQFDVQALLLEYIKRNKLRDPRRKSQIVCDARLENLFGKARVGHFEMLKLLESHFLIRDDSQIDDIQGTVVDTDVNLAERDGNTDSSIKGSKEKRRRTRKKAYEREPQSNLDDYAAIDIHNINLIYLRRKLVEDVLEDIDKFHDKVVGTFVRIRISGNNQKQDLYRLVQIVGTTKAAEPYKVGKKTTGILLEVLNLDKTEVVSIDTISNQEFTEDECKRLRQSIKCGLINRLTVGDVLDKAIEVHAARVNDWLEAEILRLSHLRDRASEKGRRKELRECVEKLQLLKTPEERRRRLEEIPEIHADPNMNPNYESEDDDSEMDDNKQENYMRPRAVSGFSRTGREPISPGRGSLIDSTSGSRKYSGRNWEFTRSISGKDLLSKGDDSASGSELLNENTWNQGRDGGLQQTSYSEKTNSATNFETTGQNNHPVVRSDSFSGAASNNPAAALSVGIEETVAKINETDKMWQYQDPSGKIQGPFSLVQLRKWSNTGYFPPDLRIWRNTEEQDNSILLTDALAGRFHQEPQSHVSKVQTVDGQHLSSPNAGKLRGTSFQHQREGERLKFDQNQGFVNSHIKLVPSSASAGDKWRSQLELGSSGQPTPPVEISELSTDRWGSDYSSRNDNLPSPTPKSSTPRGTGGQASESKWSSAAFPVQQVGPVMDINSAPGGNGQQQPSALTPMNGSQLSYSSTLSSINQLGSQEHNAVESLGISDPTSALNSVSQLIRGSGNDQSSFNGLNPAPSPGRGTVLTSQARVGESHGIHHLVEAHGWGSGSVPKQEMVPTQPSQSEAWVGGSSQNLEQNPSLPVPGQPYGQLGGMQSPATNLTTPGFSAMPQPDPWRPQVASNQPNVQPAALPNVPWGMGVAQNNTFPPGPRPDGSNIAWGPMPGNQQMGWGGPVPGTANMNWAMHAQGPMNPGWVVSTGNPGAMQGFVPGMMNPGWAPQIGNLGAMAPGQLPGNGNPGWFVPTGNQATNVQVPLVAGNMSTAAWGAQTGNSVTPVQAPAPGNANPGWAAPSGNSGTWGTEQQNNGNRFSDRRESSRGRDGKRFSDQRESSRGRDSGFDGERGWNRQPSGGHKICIFHRNGHCKKGAACDRPHS